MKEIRLDLGDRINDEQLAKVVDALENVDFTDILTISMESSDAHQADDIFEFLEERNFGFYTKGEGENRYDIIASKKYYQEPE